MLGAVACAPSLLTECIGHCDWCCIHWGTHVLRIFSNGGVVNRDHPESNTGFAWGGRVHQLRRSSRQFGRVSFSMLNEANLNICKMRAPGRSC